MPYNNLLIYTNNIYNKERLTDSVTVYASQTTDGGLDLIIITARICLNYLNTSAECNVRDVFNASKCDLVL